MLRVVTQNLNGIRSAARKGWLDWVTSQEADIVCVQEIKAQLDDLDDCMKSLGRSRGHFHFSDRKGYSGVGLYAARKPKLWLECTLRRRYISAFQQRIVSQESWK